MYDNIAVMQPYFYPYLGYFQLIDKADYFLIYGNVTFRKKSFITRNYLISSCGKPEDIKIFVKKASSNSRIIDVEMVEDEWRQKLLKKVQTIYSRAPYYDEVFPYIRGYILHPCRGLHEYNGVTIQAICKLLDIGTPLDYEHSHLDHIELELDPNLNVPVSTQRVVKLCETLKASSYFNPEGGRELYEPSVFSDLGVQLKFFEAELSDLSIEEDDQSRLKKYASIIDILMNYGIENTKVWVRKGSLHTT